MDLYCYPAVMANSGCQYHFVPINNQSGNGTPDFSQLRWEKCSDAPSRNCAIVTDQGAMLSANSSAFQANLNTRQNGRECLDDLLNNGSWLVVDNCSYVMYRLSRQEVQAKSENGVLIPITVIGIELAIETTRLQNDVYTSGIPWGMEDIPANDTRTKSYDGKTLHQPAPLYTQVQDGNISEEFTANLGGIGVQLHFRVVFKQPATAEPIATDLVVDFGNTRTVALMVERGGLNNLNEFRQKCHPVPLKKNARYQLVDDDVSQAIVNSWFMLHETEFDNGTSQPALLQKSYILRPCPRTLWLFGPDMRIAHEYQVIPIMFSQYSPVVLGDKAEDYLSDRYVVEQLLNNGALLHQSSPKRYFWDNEKRTGNSYWCRIPKRRDMVVRGLPPLRTRINNFINEDTGRIVENITQANAAESPMAFPQTPFYPRCATMIWMFMGILEEAWQFCNRMNAGVNTFRPKQLNKIVLTYPSGWTYDELQLYREQAQAAVSLFKRLNFSASTPEIELIMDTDEAVASQLPYVLSEIHSMNDSANGWIKIMGKTRDGVDSVRIMNIDIGGGTTDISIIEYVNNVPPRTNNNVKLQPSLLYRDGFGEAGDELLKTIILRVLLPCIAQQSSNVNVTSATLLDNLLVPFRGVANTAQEELNRARILRLCLIPLGTFILQQMISNNGGHFRLEETNITSDDWQAFNDFLGNPNGFPGFGTTFTYSPEDVGKEIESIFQKHFENGAKLALEHDVDILFVSGKPSEQPTMRKLACRYFPLTNDRIIFAKDYRAGDWYPFATSSDNSIKDAKSVTAVGAAIKALMGTGAIRRWHILPTVAGEQHYEWGTVADLQHPSGEPFMERDEDVGTVILSTEDYIGKRFREGGFVDCVYRFSANLPDDILATSYTTTFQRETIQGLERLKIIKVLTDQDIDVTSYCRIDVCQIPDAKPFWQDSGQLY